MSQVADKYFLQKVVGLLVWIFNQLKTFQRFALPPNGLRVIQRGTMHLYQDHDHFCVVMDFFFFFFFSFFF